MPRIEEKVESGLVSLLLTFELLVLALKLITLPDSGSTCGLLLYCSNKASGEILTDAGPGILSATSPK